MVGNRGRTIINDKNYKRYSQTKKNATNKINDLKKRGKKVTKRDRHKIIRNYFIIALVSGAVGIGTGYRLNEGSGKIEGVNENKNAIIVDLEETEKNIQIKNMTKHEIYINDLKVDLDEIDNKEELEESAEQKIAELDTSEKVKDYLKEEFTKQYNMENEEKISKENIEMYKRTEDVCLYKDIAQNGDEIVRQCTEYEAQQMGIGIVNNQGVIEVQIRNGDELKKVKAAYFNGKYSTVYEKNQEVQENIENVLTNGLGELISTGLGRAISMEQEGTSIENKQKYIEKFKNAIIEQKKSEINQIIENDKTQEDKGMEH